MKETSNERDLQRVSRALHELSNSLENYEQALSAIFVDGNVAEIDRHTWRIERALAAYDAALEAAEDEAGWSLYELFQRIGVEYKAKADDLDTATALALCATGAKQDFLVAFALGWSASVFFLARLFTVGKEAANSSLEFPDFLRERLEKERGRTRKRWLLTFLTLSSLAVWVAGFFPVSAVVLCGVSGGLLLLDWLSIRRKLAPGAVFSRRDSEAAREELRALSNRIDSLRNLSVAATDGQLEMPTAVTKVFRYLADGKKVRRSALLRGQRRALKYFQGVEEGIKKATGADLEISLESLLEVQRLSREGQEAEA